MPSWSPCLLLALALLPRCAAASSPRTVTADLCVYGGTSGGVIAAIQAERMGLKAVIVEPGVHLGGMTSGGLSWTDIGPPNRVDAVGGMAREFYERVGARYGLAPGTPFGVQTAPNHGAQIDWPRPPSLAFEPHVAEAVFTAWARESGAETYLHAPLQAVQKQGTRLVALVAGDGTVFRAKMYLDATYEGDLLAAAGIRYAVGREANAQYGETLNGVQPPGIAKFEVPIDPYLIPGQPESGPLPYLLKDEPWGVVGTADRRIQAYNYRVCLTDDPANRLPIAPPDGYDPARFELLARYTEARVRAGETLTLRSFCKYDPLPHHKFDFNNRWPISTDFIGGGADGYPEGSPAERRKIAQAHENYLRGFLHFLATSPRIPANVRAEAASFGLPRDEFTDHGGWPTQFYVREARRMVGAFVMTEGDLRGTRAVPDPIGLGAYGIDSHAVRRVVYQGQPMNEAQRSGSVPRPYGISYRSIIPQASDCENLFATFALSASHVAFASIRMEPVFMTLSQSAAIAASLAIEREIPVQRVAYADLRPRLQRAGVALSWPAVRSDRSQVIIFGATPSGIVTAVRAARQGLRVTLVSAYAHVGGIMSNGLGVFDTTYDGRRAPLYDEVHDRIMSHYPSGARGYEPHVAEEVFEQLLRAEPRITLLREWYPARAEADARVVNRVVFRSFRDGSDRALEAPMFVDASYEGDLAAVCGVAMTVGRESRQRYGEANAGVIFTRVAPFPPPGAYRKEGLQLREFRLTSTPVAGSTGAGDEAIQAFNFRVCVTDDPANRIAVARPERYERSLDQKLFAAGRWALSAGLPHHKGSWNAPILIAGNFDYPNGSWATRREIVARHRDFALGYLWFLQHDPAVPESVHRMALKFGLPKDEFQDNGGFPHEVYVREARRMVGRYVFTEHDAEAAPGSRRAPSHPDSIAITEWPLDAHSCHWDTRPGSDFEGKVLLAEATRPGQIPYAALLPKEFDNLLVTGCLSASHVGWGSLRLEPTWMHLGESAGYALALAQADQTQPANVSVPKLQRLLVDHGVMIAFFNGIRVTAGRFAPAVASAQLLAVRGGYASYDLAVEAPQ